MTFCRSVDIDFTTDASGDATVFTNVVNGRILSVAFVDTDTDATADFTITTEDTARAVLTLTDAGGSNGRWEPRTATHDNTGTAETYDGTNAVNDYIFVAGERIKIVVAQGGNATSGTFTVIYG